jgi:Glycosyl transferase family 2
VNARQEADRALQSSLRDTPTASTRDEVHLPAPSVSIIVVSKDELRLGATLDALGDQLLAEAGGQVAENSEVLVVDASAGRLEEVKKARPWARWADFEAPAGWGVTIARQRNAGVRMSTGEIVVFIDSGCLPNEGWLGRLVAPIARGDELLVSGRAVGANNTFERAAPAGKLCYLEEAPTISLAVHRSVFGAVGGFDESFGYGSDVDFTWRVVGSGMRIRYEPLATVEHDWGTFRRRMRRARQYGAARARLYRKHRARALRALYEDPVPFVYPLWLLGLPIALRRPVYLLLLVVPLWRARKHAAPLEVVLAHLAQGIGSLTEVTTWFVGRDAAESRRTNGAGARNEGEGRATGSWGTVALG